METIKRGTSHKKLYKLIRDGRIRLHKSKNWNNEGGMDYLDNTILNINDVCKRASTNLISSIYIYNRNPTFGWANNWIIQCEEMEIIDLSPIKWEE